MTIYSKINRDNVFPGEATWVRSLTECASRCLTERECRFFDVERYCTSLFHNPFCNIFSRSIFCSVSVNVTELIRTSLNVELPPKTASKWKRVKSMMYTWTYVSWKRWESIWTSWRIGIIGTLWRMRRMSRDVLTFGLRRLMVQIVIRLAGKPFKV